MDCQNPYFLAHTNRYGLQETCLENCQNQPPYPWQLDSAEAFFLGLDCIIVAGTGSRKSLPFVMPSMIHPDKILVVILPLNSLESDQAQRCTSMGITAVTVNHSTYTLHLHEELVERKYQIIFMSPEMAISNCQFNSLLCSPEYHAHMYAWCDKLHSFILTHIPLYVTSATMMLDVVAEVHRQLHIDPLKSFHINLGNNRKNIYQEVHLIRNAHNFSCVDFLFESITAAEDLERTLLFVNQVIDAQLGWQHSHRLLPPHLQLCVGFLHSRRSDASKVEELELFRTGKRRVLWVTEIGGMGLDIPDVTFVGQLGAPQSLTVWMQHAGRARRSAVIQAHAVLFLELSVLKEIRLNTKQPEPESGGSDLEEEEGTNEEKMYCKKLEPSLREYIATCCCRHEIIDALFDNPPGRLVLNTMCCDNCTEAKSSPSHPASPHPDYSDEAITMKIKAAAGELPTGRHVQQHLQDVRHALLSWRRRMAICDFPHACFTSAVLLPDPILSTLASKRSLTTLNKIHTLLPISWAFVDQYATTSPTFHHVL
ncbi:P-loop containing nucleoside triphosphate hydrolase protein [Boletus edulis]|nr:P-loop containing nucleoside triphosphate hydrolase protein [Boletus edulis]